MRVFDRYLGVNVPLPQEVEPERYQLLKWALFPLRVVDYFHPAR